MTWSWVGSFVVLCLRVLTFVDFSLMKIKIYEIPAEGPERDLILQKVKEGRISLEAHPSQTSIFASRIRQRLTTFKNKI